MPFQVGDVVKVVDGYTFEEMEDNDRMDVYGVTFTEEMYNSKDELKVIVERNEWGSGSIKRYKYMMDDGFWYTDRMLEPIKRDEVSLYED